MHTAILKTLAYADIFDYPLTSSEIIKYSIGSKVNRSNLNTLDPNIQKTGPYYHLKGRAHLVKLRRQRTRFSSQKLKIAQKVGDYLKVFPSIKMIAITGALAMNNANKLDDIDLMIVTKTNTLWLTRLLVTPFISLISTRRTPKASLPNSICINLWLDQVALIMPKSLQNLFTAHEITQVKPLWDKEGTYKIFLSLNNWINKFLPNVKIPSHPAIQPSSHSSFLNDLAFRLQYNYMKPRLTREKVTLHSAFFHPNKTQSQIMIKYKQKLKKLDISVK